MKIFLLPLILLSSCFAIHGQQVAISPTPTPTPTPEPLRQITEQDIPGITISDRRITDLIKNGQNGYIRPDAETRRKRFLSSTVGPFSLGRIVATAGVSTWTNSPEEWGTKWEGFGRRVASRFAANTIKQTTKFGLDEVLKVDSHFYRSRSASKSARARNALISPFTARKPNGKRVVGLPNIAAAYGSSIIAREAWYPDRYGWKDGVKAGTISLGFNAAFNLFKEFIWKK